MAPTNANCNVLVSYVPRASDADPDRAEDVASRLQGWDFQWDSDLLDNGQVTIHRDRIERLVRILGGDPSAQRFRGVRNDSVHVVTLLETTPPPSPAEACMPPIATRPLDTFTRKASRLRTTRSASAPGTPKG